MAKKETIKKEAPKKVAPKKEAKVPDFDDKASVLVDIKGVEHTVGGADAKILIKVGRAKFIKIAD